MSYIFPPIVDTYQKAFVIGGDLISVTENNETVTKSVIKIKYRVPATGGDAGNIEVSIRNQYNNLSVLKNGQDTATARVGEDYIYIPQSEVNVGLNQWYRIQLRYRVENQQNNTTSYSEWSTVTLIKAISAPAIELAPPFVIEEGETSITVNSQSVTVQGRLSFENSNDDETLQSYEIELLQGETIIEKSGVLYPDPFNARAIGPYQLKSTLQFLNNTNYKLNIKYTTKGFYTNEPNTEDGSSVTFTYSKGDPAILTGDFFATANNNKGYNEIQVGLTAEDIAKNKVFKIQRSSYKNNYNTRETIFTIDLNQYREGYPTTALKCPYDAIKPVAYVFSQVFADTAAEPGILYRYFLVDGQGNDYEYWGGKNLCSEVALRLTRDSGVLKSNGTIDTDYSYDYSEQKITMLTEQTAQYRGVYGLPFTPETDKYYTFSCEIKGTAGKKVCVGWLNTKLTVQLTGEYQQVSGSILASNVGSGICFYNLSVEKGGLANGEWMQFRNVQIEEGSIATAYEPYAVAYLECMLDTEHIFFTDINAQFRLNLNPNISNFKYVVQESITNTLGSAFPFVRRSGHTKYRQFSISGTICGYGDDEGIFLSKNSASLILSQDFYNRYKARNRIMPWNDYIFEKQYRDKAIEFLMDGKPKLFKSFTEGNMIVALTAVSFTPNKQLDRNIYDFSATVTEIAECTVENCQKYNCYENEAYKMYAPTEYYLVAVEVEIDGNTAVPTQSYLPYYEWATINKDQPGYLCVREVTNMLQASNLSSEPDEILANDSVIRGV